MNRPGDNTPPLDPLIKALVDRLPPPGDPWPARDRVAWLRCLAAAFDLIYGECAGLVITVNEKPAEHRG